MKVTEALAAEFEELHNRYKKADERMLMLQDRPPKECVKLE